MGIFDLFSKRQKKLRGEVPDVFTYDEIPNPLRVQVVHIITDSFGKGTSTDGRIKVEKFYNFVHEALCREYGLFTLHDSAQSDQDAIFSFILGCEETEKVLDTIELTFRSIDQYIRDRRDRGYYYNVEFQITPDDAINELNQRFKEHGIGYEYSSGEIIRVDSKLLHSEVVKPVLKLLQGNIYKGANEEFMKAHEHYRHGRNKECLSECLKSFESVMKAVCEKRKWVYNQNDTAKTLIDICLKNGLIPNYMQNQFTSLRSLMESGVPTVRNKLGGHGQGTSTISVSNHIASYALHLAATNILFLIESEKELT